MHNKINPRTGGSPWFRPPSLNEAKREGSLHAAFVIKVMAFNAISLAARLFLLQSQRLIADAVSVCNRFSQGVLHYIVWEEIQGSHLPAQEAAAYHQPYPGLVLLDRDMSLTTCHSASHTCFAEVTVFLTTARDVLSDYLMSSIGPLFEAQEYELILVKSLI